MPMSCPTPDASPELLSQALGISIRQARRYKAAGRLPFAYAVVWAVLAEGDLGVIDPAFAGWTIRDGQVYAPEGYGFRPGELRAIPLRNQQLAHLERELSQPRQLMLCAAS
jgi:hypothetical protein